MTTSTSFFLLAVITLAPHVPHNWANRFAVAFAVLGVATGELAQAFVKGLLQ
jgi:hypothetical protein